MIKFTIVIAIAANKGDLYDNEEVDESVGRNFAKENCAIFRYTSAKNASGIDDLFRSVGSKYIDPNYEEGGEFGGCDPDVERVRSQTIKIGKDDKKNNQNQGCKC